MKSIKLKSNIDESLKTFDDALQKKKIECISKLKIILSEFKNSLENNNN